MPALAVYRLNRCCGAAELGGIGMIGQPVYTSFNGGFAKKLTAEAALKELVNHGSSAANFRRYNTIFMTAATGDGGKRVEPSYGKAFRELIEENNLGPITASPPRINGSGLHTGSYITAYVWLPDHKEITKWAKSQKRGKKGAAKAAAK